MIDNIIDKIENYLNYQNEIQGNIIYYSNNNTSVKYSINLVKEEVIEVKKEKKIETKEVIIENAIESNLLEKEAPSAYIPENWNQANNADELKNLINKCTKCSLGFTRKNFVFGSGNPNADIMLIGEAPGADEDEQGLPFVGRAGQLLTKIIEAINLSREEVFICNILKCRPPSNRKPLTSEVEDCEPYLKKQIELIKPKFILLLGLTAAETLLKSNVKMADIRGNLVEYQGIKTLVTYHPAALLRNPNWKPLVWEDVKLLRRLYDEYLNNKEN
jgi:uracil-DNA glycosylase family 4